MSDTQHTPGPWEQLPELDEQTGEPTGRLDDVICGPAYTQHFAGEDHHGVRDTVCVVGFSAHRSHQANARLICAAPLMLEELLACEKELTDAGHDGKSDDAACRVLGRIRAAIAATKEPK